MKIALIVGSVLFALVVSYLPFAFYWLSFDPSSWGQDARMGYVLFAMWLAGTLGSIVGMSK